MRFSLRGPNWIALIAAVAAIPLLASMTQALAGPGHDHGPMDPLPAGPASPRLVAESETYELVGILNDAKLTIYLDRRADTSPVTDARLELIVDGEAGAAEPQPDGTYTFASPAFDKRGDKEIFVTISDKAASDLLVGTLSIKRHDREHQHDHDPFGHDHSVHHAEDGKSVENVIPKPVLNALRLAGLTPADVERKFSNAAVVGGLGLMLGILIGALVLGRQGLRLGLAGLVVVLGSGIALAGPGHDHGHDHSSGSAEMSGDAPRRLQDGSIALPKPTQRLLDIRTRILEPETTRATQALIGRIIADPNRTGLVQSTIGGRIKPTEGGLPVLGQRVRAGQTLALVEPTFSPIDASDVRQTAGDLDQRITLLETRIKRQEQLVERNVAGRANLEDLEIELAGLQARRRILAESRRTTEPLTAPIDGVISSADVAAGQVVAPADTLLHIVDPTSLWVEAISYDADLVIDGAGTLARLPTGETFELDFVGRSRALSQQAVRFQFRLKEPSDALHIGSPIKVLVETGAPVAGLIVPRAAIAQAPNGQMIAFKRQAPERYAPMAVRFERVDVDRVLVTGGLNPGDQIIVRGAPLVNQIR